MNKTILVTGSTDGIGKQTAFELAKLGAKVLIHARSKDRGLPVLDEIRRSSSNQDVQLYIADFASLEEVKSMADQIKKDHEKIDVLINNAGVLLKTFHKTDSGFEKTFCVNHLAPFSLTVQLLPLLKRSEQSRILNISSIAHTNSPLLGLERLHDKIAFGGYQTYALTKLCNVLFTYELVRKLDSTNITANALHPGTIGTKLLKAGFNMGGASWQTGAQTPVYLATNDELHNTTGKYFTNMQEVSSSAYSYKPELREMLWNYSEECTEIYFNHYF